MTLAAGFAQPGAARVTRFVQTPVLDIGYEESGNATGFPVVLLHGFPDDARAWDEVEVPPHSWGGASQRDHNIS